MRNRRVGGRKLALGLVFGQLGEEDRGGVGGFVERPLEEVDFGALGLVGDGEDELGREGLCGLFHGEVGGCGDDGAEVLGGLGVAEAPDCCEFLFGQGADFGEVDYFVKGFDARRRTGDVGLFDWRVRCLRDCG